MSGFSLGERLRQQSAKASAKKVSILADELFDVFVRNGSKDIVVSLTSPFLWDNYNHRALLDQLHERKCFCRAIALDENVRLRILLTSHPMSGVPYATFEGHVEIESFQGETIPIQINLSNEGIELLERKRRLKEEAENRMRLAAQQEEEAQRLRQMEEQKQKEQEEQQRRHQEQLAREEAEKQRKAREEEAKRQEEERKRRDEEQKRREEEEKQSRLRQEALEREAEEKRRKEEHEQRQKAEAIAAAQRMMEDELKAEEKRKKEEEARLEEERKKAEGEAERVKREKAAAGERMLRELEERRAQLEERQKTLEKEEEERKKKEEAEEWAKEQVTARALQQQKPSRKRVAVVGASSLLGLAVLDALSGKDVDVVAVSRSDCSASVGPNITWRVVFSFADVKLMAEALSGVSIAFLVLGRSSVDPTSNLLPAVVQACKDANIASVVVPSLEAYENTSSLSKRLAAMEGMIQSSYGQNVTFLRMAFPLDTFLHPALRDHVRQGFVVLPVSAVSFAFTCFKDVGMFASTVLLDYAPHAGKAYYLTSGLTSGEELATGFKVVYKPGEIELIRRDLEQSEKWPFSSWESEAFAEWMSVLARGKGLKSSPDLRSNISCSSVSTWVEANKEEFKPVEGSGGKRGTVKKLASTMQFRPEMLAGGTAKDIKRMTQPAEAPVVKDVTTTEQTDPETGLLKSHKKGTATLKGRRGAPQRVKREQSASDTSQDTEDDQEKQEETTAAAPDGRVLVLEIGNNGIKFGWADRTDIFLEANMVVLRKAEGRSGKPITGASAEALMRTNPTACEVVRPIDATTGAALSSANRDAAFAMVRSCLERAGFRSTQDTLYLLSPLPVGSEFVRAVLDEMIGNDFHKVALGWTPVLQWWGFAGSKAEQDTALVVDIGAGLVQVVPVYCGSGLENSALRRKGGSSRCMEALERLLQLRGDSRFAQLRRQTPFAMTAALESCLATQAYVALDFAKEMQKFGFRRAGNSGWVPQDPSPSSPQWRSNSEPLSVDSTWPLGMERFYALEAALFDPSLLDENATSVSLPALCAEAIKQAPNDIHEEMLRNVVVCGGVARVPGLSERLAFELRKTFPNTNVDVFVGPVNGAVVGGRIVSSQSSFKERVVTDAEYFDGVNPALKAI